MRTPESALLATLASIVIAAGLATAQETASPLPRWVVTHSMGMMPATNWFGMNGLFPLTEYAKSRPEHYFSRNYGGKYRMLPLGALHAYTGKDGTYNFNRPFLYPTERPELSIRPEYLRDRYRWDLEWAERMGVDGFGALLSRNAVSKKHAVGWFGAMERILAQNPETNLRVTIMFSGHELPNEEEAWRYEWLKEFCQEYKDSPAWFRHDGRIVLMGYRSMMTWNDREGVDVEQARHAVNKHQEFMKSLDIGDPMFLFDGTEYVPGDISSREVAPDPQLLAPIAEEVCKSFDGYMVWGGVIPEEIYRRNYPVIAEAVNKAGKAWGMPIINIHSGVGQFYISRPGVQRLIDTWNMAHETNAQFAQIVTWNDWYEATGYGPSISLNYAFTSLNAKFAHRFKHGAFPESEDDTVYLFYRKYHPHSDPYLYPRATIERDRNRWGETDDMLHIIVFAGSAGTINISGTSEGVAELKLEKGYNEFKLKTALNQEIAARIYRDDRLEHKLVSPERVTDRPFREDLIPWGWSSDCRRYYDLEFGKGFRPVSHYSQRYADGIPDWFRLLYFGTTELPEGGLPTDDPDDDGIDNLTECLLGEDPTRPNPVYEPGYVWDEIPKALSPAVDQQYSARVNFNPYPDKNGKLVHTFLYQKDGEPGGPYLHMNKWNNQGTVGWSLRNWSPFRYYLSDDNGIAMDLLPGHAGIYRFWSPVAGRLHVRCTLKGDAVETVSLRIRKGGRELLARPCPSGKEANIELEVEIALRDGLDFIVRGDEEADTQVVLLPEIRLVTPRSSH